MATVTFKGKSCSLCGTELNVGDAAPQVNLVNSKGMTDKAVGGSNENTQLIVVVPSLDTEVCASETRRFNKEASGIEGIEVVVVSMDLPFAATRFCSTEGIESLTVTSDFVSKAFANAYGVLIADGPLVGLACRAIFVVNKDGKITYKEIVSELTDEPDYEAAIAGAKDAASAGASCCGTCQ